MQKKAPSVALPSPYLPFLFAVRIYSQYKYGCANAF